MAANSRSTYVCATVESGRSVRVMMPIVRTGCAPMAMYSYRDAFYHELEPGHKPEFFTRFWREGGVARIEATSNGVKSVSFLPTQATSLESGQPHPLKARDRSFKSIVTYLKWASEGLRGAPAFKVRGDAIEIYRQGSGAGL